LEDPCFDAFEWDVCFWQVCYDRGKTTCMSALWIVQVFCPRKHRIEETSINVFDVVLGFDKEGEPVTLEV